MKKFTALALATTMSVCPIAAGASANKGEDSSADKSKDAKSIGEDLSAIAKSIEELRNKPSDTVKENGAEMEAAILSAGAIAKAGQKIAEQRPDTTTTYIVIGADQTLALDAALAFDAEYYGINAILENALPRAQRITDVPSETGGALPVAAITGGLQLLSSLLRSETEISNLTGVLTNQELLVLATAKNMPDKAILPNHIIASNFGPGDNVFAKLTRLQSLRDRLAPIARSETQKAALKKYDDFIAALTKRDDDGAVKLVAVLKAAKLAGAINDGKDIIRVKIEKSGGTLLKRKNLFVALGASALGISGGLVATYSVSDPKTGTVRKSGVITCRTGVMSFKKVHNWNGSSTNCDTF